MNPVPHVYALLARGCLDICVQVFPAAYVIGSIPLFCETGGLEEWVLP